MTALQIYSEFGINTLISDRVLSTDEEILRVIKECVEFKKVKNNAPYTRFEPCICGCNRRARWFGNGEHGPYVELVCKNCGLSVKGSNENQAKIEWNKLVKGKERV